MKMFLAALIVLLAVPAFGKGGNVSVRGYTRANGTYVAPYTRTAPNGTDADNFSTQGNVNPYTGRAGDKPCVRDCENAASDAETGTVYTASGNDNYVVLRQPKHSYNRAALGWTSLACFLGSVTSAGTGLGLGLWQFFPDGQVYQPGDEYVLRDIHNTTVALYATSAVLLVSAITIGIVAVAYNEE